MSEVSNGLHKCPECHRSSKLDSLRIQYQNEDKDLAEYMLTKLNLYSVKQFHKIIVKKGRTKHSICIG